MISIVGAEDKRDSRRESMREVMRVVTRKARAEVITQARAEQAGGTSAPMA
jgi:hypothetical protein